MKQERIGWGILGAGYIAGHFARDLKLEGLTVAAVGSRSKDSARAFAAEHGIPAAHGGYEALVADPGVDVVYVATPHPFHAEHALLALRAGKHVLVEKPFALNAAQARTVLVEAQARGLLVLEAMWTLFLPHLVRLRHWISEGRLGELRTVLADHGQLLPSHPEHRANNAWLGGGALLDLGVYPVSLAVDLLGAPAEVRAVSTPLGTGVDAQTSILLRSHARAGSREAHAVLQCGLDARGPSRASVIGTSGRVDIPGVWYRPAPLELFDAGDTLVERWDRTVPGRGMQFQALEAERCIRGSLTASPVLPPQQTVAVMEVLDAVRAQIGLVYPQERTNPPA